MQVVKQSTVASVLVGPVLDSDGVEYASAAIGDFNITKNGTSAAMAATATATHDHNGHYVIAMTTGNTDTLGRLNISCNKATYAMPPYAVEVLQATVFDAMVTNAAGGANGLLLSLASNQVDVGKWLGTAVPAPGTAGVPSVDVLRIGGTVQTARDIGLSVLLSSGTGTGQLKLASGYVAMTWADIAAQTTTVVLSGTTVGVVTLTNTLTTYTGNTLQTGDSFARIGAAGVSLTSVALADATSDAVIADAIWNAATATYGTAGSYGLLVETNLDATVSSRLASASYTAPSNLTAAQIATGVWQDATAGDFTVTLSVGKTLYTSGVVPGAAGGLFIAGSNAATTVNITGNLIGTVSTLTTYTGNTLQTANVATLITTVGAAGVGLTAVALADTTSDGVIADAVWNAATVDYGSAGTYGILLENNLDAAVTSRMATYTQPTGFLAATFPTTVASTTNITGGTITTVTNLTNLPAITANWLTAAGLATDAVTEIQAGLATPTNITAGTITTVTTLTNLPAITTDWLTATGLAASAATEIADALLARNVAGGSSTGRTVSEALYRLRNRNAVSAGTLSIYLVDDTTVSWTAALTTGSAAVETTDCNPA